MDTNTVRGLRIARLDRVLDALAGRPAVGDRERPARRPRRPRVYGSMPPLTLRFLPTV
jgi:hypothetical protein